MKNALRFGALILFGAVVASGSGCGGTTAGVPTYSACSGPGECSALVPGCCGVCGEPGLADVVGVNTTKRAEFKSATCDDPTPTCPKCAQMQEPSLVAFCKSGACAALDIRKDSLSSCRTDEDCVVRDANCCESCVPTAFELVALAKTEVSHYRNEICAPDQGCPACVPMYPANVRAACGSGGHCQAVERTNVCPGTQPREGEACSGDASLRCEYGNDPRPACRTHASCASGAWQIAISGCPPLPGPGVSGCPAAPPDGGACQTDGLVCDMGDDTLCACSTCTGGPCSLAAHWSCAGAPSTPGCPSRAPELGSACASDQNVCTYGPSCVESVATRRRCDNGAWIEDPMVCPV